MDGAELQYIDTLSLPEEERPTEMAGCGKPLHVKTNVASV
jgi:hypothetical protein